MLSKVPWGALGVIRNAPRIPPAGQWGVSPEVTPKCPGNSSPLTSWFLPRRTEKIP